MTTPNPKKAETKAGMWSTITAAVEGGWGATGRLVVILAVVAAAIVAVILVSGGGAVMMGLRSLVLGL
ncbi:hypothetical protein BKA24_002542 [Microbacterium marinum]|uniref:Uncharacterized protein n=1 Tax=Microbacterium marinum TaxID=421115 RepID=A0A7W7BUH0_9MICO|nr:hypothetical protein [Microbacterium marinum]MBB4667833.1 hypothetical protein [Microbacterium marinum]